MPARATPTNELHLEFFGRTVRVTCDAADVARDLALIYDRLRCPRGALEREALQMRVQADGPKGGLIVVGRRVVRVPSRQQLVHHAHLVLVNAAAAGASKRLVLHGGAVARNGRAIAYLAPSGGGKTTTTLALLQRGWRLLSDDFVVVAPGAVVEPFPRRLNVTDATADMLGLSVPTDAVRVEGPGRAGKWMVDPRDFGPASVATATPLHALFVVEPREDAAGARGAPASASGRQVRHVEIDHLPDWLPDRVRAVPGVVEVRREPVADRLVLSVTSDGSPIVGALDRVLAAAEVAVIGASGPGIAPPPPGQRPVTERLDIRRASRAVLPHDLGLAGRRFLAGTRADDVAEAIERVGGMLAVLESRSYRLWPGELDATVDLIEACSGVPTDAHHE